MQAEKRPAVPLAAREGVSGDHLSTRRHKSTTTPDAASLIELSLIGQYIDLFDHHICYAFNDQLCDAIALRYGERSLAKVEQKDVDSPTIVSIDYSPTNVDK
jgi:hypothetical protein